MHTAAEDLFDHAEHAEHDTVERRFHADCVRFVTERQHTPRDYARAARMCRRMAEKFSTAWCSDALKWRIEAEWYEERGGISDASE